MLAAPGNPSDPKTVPEQVTKLQERFGLEHVVLVGDRGLLTQVQIEHLKRSPGLGWASTLNTTHLRALVEQEALQLSLFDAQRLGEFVCDAYPGERLWRATTRCWPVSVRASARRCSKPPRRGWSGSRARRHGAPASR